MRKAIVKILSMLLTVMLIVVAFPISRVVNAEGLSWVGAYNDKSEHGQVSLVGNGYKTDWCSACGCNKENGDVITASAQPDAGYVFKQWVDEDDNYVSDQQTYVFTVSKDTYLYAIFESDPSSQILASIRNLYFGFVEEGYNNSEYCKDIKMKTGFDYLNNLPECLKLELTAGDTEAFVLDYTFASSGVAITDLDTEYIIATIKPVSGLYVGTYTVTATLSYDEDGVGTDNDWVVLDTAEIVFSVDDPEPPSKTSWVGAYNDKSEHGQVSLVGNGYKTDWCSACGCNKENGDVITASAQPDAGYVFKQWVDEDDNYVSDQQTYVFTVSKDTYLYAIFIPAYTVTFNNNGNGSAPATQTVISGDKPTKPADLTADGYTFGGWYTDSACTKAYDFNSEVTSNITLYAKWTATSTPAPSTPAPTTPAPSTTGGGFEDFVERLYTVALNRASEPEGKAFWCEHVGNGDLDGAQCAKEFLLSKEFNDRGLDDKQFLEVLYKTFFNRDAADDPDGFNFWMNSLKTQGRDVVVDCFINSEEWCNVCASYGVRSGATRAKATIASANATAFATRLYTECLGRDPEEGGLKFWSLGLTNQELSGTQAAKEFFYSPEFVNAKYSDEEYIYRMYKTFMGREPEAEGKAYWLSELKNGTTRDEVFNFFSTCPEFTGICKEYAIVR